MKQKLQSLIQISEEPYEAFEKAGKSYYVPKGAIINTPGKITRRIYFVEDGILRGYRLVDAKEFTHYFYLENWFATDYKSYLLETQSELYIQALTDVSLIEFDRKNLLELFEKYHPLEKLGRLIAERAYLTMNERLINFQIKDLKTRYQNLINSNPGLFNKVSQKFIASYLGVAEQSLSRIKSSNS